MVGKRVESADENLLIESLKKDCTEICACIDTIKARIDGILSLKENITIDKTFLSLENRERLDELNSLAGLMSLQSVQIRRKTGKLIQEIKDLCKKRFQERGIFDEKA